MNKPQTHVFVCKSFRMSGDPQGVCAKKGQGSLLQYMEEEILDRGMDVLVSTTGCLKACEKGPVVVVQPQNIWYGYVSNEQAVDTVLDAIEQGEEATGLKIG